MKRALLATFLLAFPTFAPGAIVWFPTQDIPIPNTFDGVSVDLETGATSTAAAGLTGGDANFVRGGGGVTNDADQNAVAPSWQPLRLGPNNTDSLRKLGVGDMVGPGEPTFSTGFGGSGDPNSHFPEFTPGTPGFIGFSLVLDNSNVVHGWMRVTLQDNNDPGGVIHEWAYEDNGGPIMVRAIPEPGSAMLLLLAAGGFVLRRIR